MYPSHTTVWRDKKLIQCMCALQYMLGRHTTAIPRVASSTDFIQPTQGFDCHISVLPPSKNDSLQSQFDRSQVHFFFTLQNFIYEVFKKFLQVGSLTLFHWTS